MSQRTRRRRTRLSRADRERQADHLHLLADGDHRGCANEFAPNAMTPAIFAALWAEHGDEIRERWTEAGHQPSAWWLAMARRAGVKVRTETGARCAGPGSCAVAKLPDER